METSIVKIGNSRGVVIPSAVLKALDMSEHSMVSMTIDKNAITIKKTSARAGWEAAAKKMHEAGDDKLLIPDVFEDEALNDWTW